MRSWNVDPFDKTRGCVLYIISTLEDTWRNAFLMNPRVCHLSTLRVHNASLTYNIDVSRPPILLLFIAPSRWDFHFSIFSSTKINVTCYLLSTVDKYSSFFSFIDQLLQARRIRNFSKSLNSYRSEILCTERERERLGLHSPYFYNVNVKSSYYSSLFQMEFFHFSIFPPRKLSSLVIYYRRLTNILRSFLLLINYYKHERFATSPNLLSK